MSRLMGRVIIGAWILLGLTGCAGTGGSGSSDHARLLNAVVLDDAAYVKSAVQAGLLHVNQRIPAEGYPDGAPVIAIAARSASLNVLRYLISAGADVNSRTPVNETPLMLASFFSDESLRGLGRAFERHERAARLLVEAGAELENYPHHYTPLAYAAYQGNDNIVRFLIQRGARVNSDAARGGAYINTPLMMAAIQGHERVVKVLLGAGADADVRIVGGLTAAELAAKHNHRALAQLLICAQRRYSNTAPECRNTLGAFAP